MYQTNKKQLCLVLTILLIATQVPKVFSDRNTNIKLLQTYFDEYKISKLEWEMLQFNFQLHENINVISDYFNHCKLTFDYQNMQFTIVFFIDTKEQLNGSESFLTSTHEEKMKILEATMDKVFSQLILFFPVTKHSKQLLRAEFRYPEEDNDYAILAKYENGELRILE